jgi:YafQ family addiction module toxin component
MRKVEIDKRLEKQLNILFKKDRRKYLIIKKKMEEIKECSNPGHYKNLRAPFQELKEVHINTHFILTFQYIESKDTLIFSRFCHHNDL